MRAQSAGHRTSDVPLTLSLVWTAVISFGLLLTRSTPDPVLFVPVAIAALPFAAAPRHRLVARLLAALLLAAYLGWRGPELESLLLAPAVAALLLSAYGLAREAPSRVRPRPRRARRG